MKINIRYASFAFLTLSFGVICLKVSLTGIEPGPIAVEAGRIKSRRGPAVQPGQARHAAAEAFPHDGTEPMAPEGSAAELALLDRLASDIAKGRGIEEVVAALSGGLSSGMRDAAVRLFTGEVTASFAGFDSLPPAFVNALKAALRKQEDQGGLSRALESAWLETNDPVVRRRLESLEIPGLFAALVADSNTAGDTEVTLSYLSRLEFCEHPGTTDALTGLATQPGIDLNELCGVALSWAGRFPGLANPADLAARLSDPEFSPGQRIIAASALAGAAPGAETTAALDKATGIQPAPEWRAAIEAVRDLASNPPQTFPFATD